jgi:photosystem II stability/assembly factor-like uncharacterized protein
MIKLLALFLNIIVMQKFNILLLSAILGASPLVAQKTKKEDNKKDQKKAESSDPLTKSGTFSALAFRNIGPAVTSGRVIDIAVNPKNKSEWYIAAAAGGVFKTKNSGVTFEPIFDGQDVYSIGCLAIDPNNTNIIWVGSGENNNQRAVGYGDGIYKSEDGGKSFTNLGLKRSEHIGMIAIDPRNSDVVYAAAYGPVWKDGGDRGIYKTTDGGKNWKQVLTVSEHTGFNEVHIDKKNPDVLYACAHQRRRHEWTYISGGPESAIYKSKDGGATWDKLTSGLPSGDIGRITLAISPINTEVLYAMCEGRENKGFYKSTDMGASWEKQSGKATDGNYYQEIIADPKIMDKIYVMDTWANVTTDGGKTFKGLGEKHKHVDNHAIWIDPDNSLHYLMGCDGGLYETFDGAVTWDYKANLPITQFYRVALDNSKPFYNIYGGTQDNNTLGGPSRTMSGSGITNADWFVTVGGDGFQSRVDPQDPNIIYSEWQYGGLVRYDKRSGERVDIKPVEKEGEPAYRWNWDAPIIISNFDNKRIYFAANKVFRSDDRGNSWKVISPDLSRGIDRNKLPVMGKVWSVDAVAKNASTSIFGNITALSESPKNDKIIYAGTDDGLIHMTDNGGSSWSKIDNIAGVPSITAGNYKMQPLVNYLLASQHNENIAYAVFNNHRQGDFKPYLMKTTDKGKTWTNIGASLPEHGAVYSVAEDHKNSNLLFCGTEFGFYFSLDAGKTWTELTAGLPSAVCIKDIAIQKDENDIVLASFGRGFFVLDDYSVLQNIKAEDLKKPAYIFPIKDGLVFNQSTPYGHKGKSFQGESFFTSPNPPVGATITYYLADDHKTLKERRKEREKERMKNNEPVYYPSIDTLRMEDYEQGAFVLAVITDEQNNEIRKIKLDAKKGMKRFTWDGRYEVTTPVNFYEPDTENPYYSPDEGPVAVPGKYFVQLMKVNDGKIEQLTERTAFNIKTLNQSSMPLPDQQKLIAFNKELSEFRRIVHGSADYFGYLKERMKYLKQGIIKGSTNSLSLLPEVAAFDKKAIELDIKLNGDASLAKREFESLPGFVGSLETIVGNSWGQSLGVTPNHEEKFAALKANFKPLYASIVELKDLVESLELKAEDIKMPATTGRLPKCN